MNVCLFAARTHAATHLISDHQGLGQPSVARQLAQMGVSVFLNACVHGLVSDLFHVKLKQHIKKPEFSFNMSNADGWKKNVFLFNEIKFISALNS